MLQNTPTWNNKKYVFTIFIQTLIHVSSVHEWWFAFQAKGGGVVLHASCMLEWPLCRLELSLCVRRGRKKGNPSNHEWQRQKNCKGEGTLGLMHSPACEKNKNMYTGINSPQRTVGQSRCIAPTIRLTYEGLHLERPIATLIDNF